MDLSKTFQKLNYYLLIAKLGTYGFQIDAKRYMKNYLTYKKQRIRENKIIRVAIDNKLNFKSHVNSLSKKASQKIAPLSRLFGYPYNTENNFFFQLDNKIPIYLLPSLWLFYSRTLNNIISKLHERSLTNILNDLSKDFNALLEKKQDTSNHHRYIQTLVTEVFRMKNEPALSTMESIVYTGISIYKVRNFQEFETDRERLFVMVWKRFSYRYPQP